MNDASTARDDRRLARLREELLDLQERLRREPAFAVAFIIAGAPASGRSEVLHELLGWLDPKHVDVHAFPRKDRSARKRPVLERYWRALPPRGRIAFYFAGWYEDYVAETMARADKKRRGDHRAAERIRRLEAMLTADGVRIVKVYLSIDAKTQRERLQRLRADKLTRWRVTREDVRLAKNHRRLARAAALCMKATDQAGAEWRVVDGADEHGRLLSVARLLRDALRSASTAREQRNAVRTKLGQPAADAARSGASLRRSTCGSTASCPSARRRPRNHCAPIYGASGAAFPSAAPSPSTIARGTAACSSSACAA